MRVKITNKFLLDGIFITLSLQMGTKYTNPILLYRTIAFDMVNIESIMLLLVIKSHLNTFGTTT